MKNKKITMKIFFIILLFSFSVFITSCNNIILDGMNLDNIIDKNIVFPDIPVSNLSSNYATFSYWANIPVMLTDENEGLSAGDIIEFKIAINSSRTEMYFYFRTTTTIAANNENYIIVLSNDLECDGMRVDLGGGYPWLFRLCNNTSLDNPGGSVAAGNQIAGLLLLTTYNNYHTLNDKIYLSVYSTIGPMQTVYPVNDSVQGRWVWFRPQ